MSDGNDADLQPASAFDFTALQREWAALLDSDDSKDELTLQRYLERHPCLLPGARTVDTQSGHDPWPHAVVSQPKLPGLSDKFPDFMWIAKDSAFLYPILIEIETPWKRWFQLKSVKQHSELTTARDQLNRWRGWFSEPSNQAAFKDLCSLPRELRGLTLSPRYVLIHGRRSEANRSPAYVTMRGQLARNDERFMTFDRLQPDGNAAEYFTVTINEHGFDLLQLPPYIRPRAIPEDVIRCVNGLREALKDMGVSVSDDQPPGYRFRPPKPKSERKRRPEAPHGNSPGIPHKPGPRD